MVKKIKRKRAKKLTKHDKWMFMASYPLAIETQFAQPFQLDLSSEFPKAAMRPISTEINEQIMKGGSYISVEFETTKEVSIIQAINEGTNLVEDLIALLSLTSGIPVLECKPIQILQVYDQADICAFASFLNYHHMKWHESLTSSDLHNVQVAYMHCKGLEAGYRIRRAIKRYGEALGRVEPLDAFQMAFMGLEALEKPLAQELGIEPGVEVLKGKCASCGAEFERRKTALNAVKQYVYGKLHVERDGRAEQGEKEWKSIIGLRHALFHAYEDPEKLAKNAHEILPAVFHHLHDACAHLAHLHELESNEFEAPSHIIKDLIYIGEVELKKKPSIAEWQPLLDANLVEWKKTENIMTPSFKVTSPWYSEGIAKSIGGHFYFLNRDIRIAQEEDLQPARHLGQ